MAQNRQLAEEFYAAMGRGDAPAAIALIDPQVVWNEAENFLYADKNPYVGLDAVLSGVFGRLMADWEGFSATPEEFVDGGDTVVVFGRYGGVYRATGAKVHAQFVHVMRFQNGKIAGFQQYTDTAQFAEAVARRAGA
jgi:uncharacterized protein